MKALLMLLLGALTFGWIAMSITAAGREQSPGGLSRLESPASTPASEPLPAGASIQTVMSDMVQPVAVVLDPAGRIFYTEKTGAVRLIVGGVRQPTPVITFDVDSCTERGM